MRHAGVVLLLTGFLAGPAGSQQVGAALGLSQLFGGGAGIARACTEELYATGLGSRLELPAGPRFLSVAATGRVYPFGGNPNCFVDVFVPQNGTYNVDHRLNLQATRFGTTDLRLQAAPIRWLRVGLGGGVAWHPGSDLPYVVGSAGLRLFTTKRVYLSLDAEYYRLRTTTEHSRVTYVNYVLVASEPLGRTREWSRAFTVCVSGGIIVF